MPAPHAPKKAAPTAAATPTPADSALEAENATHMAAVKGKADASALRPAGVLAAFHDPLAAVQQKLDAAKAAEKASHLATYRRAVNALAVGRAIPAEEEEALAAALGFFGLDTSDLKRDTATVKTVEDMKKNLGATVEDRVRRGDAEWVKVKASAANLEKLRDELKKAESVHAQFYGACLGRGESCAALDRLIGANPRVFAPDWPLPKAEPAPMHSNPLPVAPPPPPPPPVTEVYHPWLGHAVPITPEKFAELSNVTLAQNATLQQQAAFDKQLADRRAAAANKDTPAQSKEPVAYFDATKIAD